MADQPSVSALILAAGSATRFGGDKLLAPLRGRPLADHVAQTVAQAIAAGVLGAGIAIIPPAVPQLSRIFTQRGLATIENPDSAEGLATSVRRGLTTLAAEAGAGAALIILADQPRLRLEVIAALVEEWRAGGTSVRPRYQDSPDQPGHPVLLDRSLWALAQTLRGDRGLRESLEHGVVLMDLPGSNPDVDTPADLRQLEQQ